MGVPVGFHPTTLAHGGFGAGESRSGWGVRQGPVKETGPFCGLVGVFAGFVSVSSVMMPVCVSSPSQAFWGRLTGCLSDGFAERVGVV